MIILTPGFPKDENDTTCLPTQQLFARTLKHVFPKLEVKIIALHYPYYQTTYKWHGIDVYPLNGNSRKGILRLLTWYKCYSLLAQIVSQQNTLGILSFWCNETALIGKYFSKRRKIDHKIWISGQDAKKENVFVKWIKPSPNDLVAMSDFLKTEFYKNHKIEVGHVVYNGVAATFTNVSKDIDIVGVGSLIPLKQYEVFMSVVAETRRQKPSLTAVLVGKGPEEKNLKKLIKDLSLEEKVQMPGEVDHDTLMAWMNRARVLLHPSQYEGYSTVCLEALANGCHVVSFVRAETNRVKNWHVVKDQSEMTAKTKQLLESEADFKPVLMRDIETTVKQMISLFPGNP